MPRRQGDRHGAVAAGLELGGNVAPDRPVEPQAGDQQDAHISSPSPLRSGRARRSQRSVPVPDDRGGSGRSGP